jgi:hypothetical protein
MGLTRHTGRQRKARSSERRAKQVKATVEGYKAEKGDQLLHTAKAKDRFRNLKSATETYERPSLQELAEAGPVLFDPKKYTDTYTVKHTKSGSEFTPGKPIYGKRKKGNKREKGLQSLQEAFANLRR